MKQVSEPLYKYWRVSEMGLPSLRDVSRMVREANAAWEGGEFCALSYAPEERPQWSIDVIDSTGIVGVQFGREWLPGDGKPLDATAVARRLLAAFTDATTNQRS